MIVNHLETLIVPPALHSLQLKTEIFFLKGNSKCIRWMSPSVSPDSSSSDSKIFLCCFGVNAMQSFKCAVLYVVSLHGYLAALPKIFQATGNMGCCSSDLC